MQQQNWSSEEFSTRSDRLAKRLGGSLRDLAPRLGISQSALFAYRRGKIPITAKAWATLDRLELALNMEHPEKLDDALGEPEPAPYGQQAITRAQIETKMRAFLDAAERVPGGLGFASVLVSLHLRPEQLRDLDPAHVELTRHAQAIPPRDDPSRVAARAAIQGRGKGESKISAA